MAASAFVVSADDFVSISHVLFQSLLARFFWEFPHLFRLIQSTLKRKWDLRISLEVHDLYQLFFSNKSDVGRVVGQRLVSYDDLSVAVQRWATPSLEIYEQLRLIKFVVWLLDLPKSIRSPIVGKGIASVIGNVLDVGIFDCATERTTLSDAWCGLLSTNILCHCQVT
ncbi:hypothetical protein LINGRAHAP2_LOCUS15298 [Linum grandiflorum]